MEPIADRVAVAEATAPPSPNRLKAIVAALAIAGVLTAWGAASTFAASPSASPSASGHSGTAATHNCPAHSTRSKSN